MRLAWIGIGGLLPFAAMGCTSCSACPPARIARDEEASRTPSPPPPRDVAAADDHALTRVEMRNVRFRAAEGVVVSIRRWSGYMPRTDPAHPPDFDVPSSFSLRAAFAEIALDVTDLGRLMNDHVLAYAGAPLRQVELSPRGSRLHLRGTLARPLPVAIEMEMEPSAFGGEIGLAPRSIKVLGLEVGGLVLRSPTSLSSLIDLKGARGIRLEGTTLVLDPKRMLPAPALEGSVSAVRVEGREVVVTLGRAEDAPPPAPLPLPGASNYMHFRDGTLRFGRLFDVPADLEIVDADPADPFEFDLHGYVRQLVAGYSRNQRSGAIVVVMPDADDAERGIELAAPDVGGARSEGHAPCATEMLRK